MQVDWAQMQGGRSPIYAFLATLGSSGFIPKLCWPYRAKTKGKVERMVRYLRYSFYLPLMTHLQQQHSVIDCDTANREVKKWLYKVANQRLHQTNLERPCDRWQHIEQPLLLPLPSYSPLLTPAQPLERLPLDSQPLHHPLAIYDCFCREVLMKLQPQRLQQLAEPLQLDSLGR